MPNVTCVHKLSWEAFVPTFLQIFSVGSIGSIKWQAKLKGHVCWFSVGIFTPRANLVLSSSTTEGRLALKVGFNKTKRDRTWFAKVCVKYHFFKLICNFWLYYLHVSKVPYLTQTNFMCMAMNTTTTMSSSASPPWWRMILSMISKAFSFSSHFKTQDFHEADNIQHPPPMTKCYK